MKDAVDPLETGGKESFGLGIRGTGRMAARIRGFDWAVTPVGAMGKWSPVLLGTVNLVLASPIPMQLLWGREFIILYNDAFSRQLGSMDLSALGRPASTVWQHAWPLVEAQLAATMDSGAISDNKAAFVPMERNGAVEETFWDFSYSPVYESDGSVAGVLNLSREVTPEVLAQRELRKLEIRSDQILDSIGEAVVVTDVQANVTRMNRVAESLTGWTMEQALGQPLSRVFHIVHAQTREPLESPAARVLRLGTVIGLEHQTLLLRKDGSELPIEHSGSPIRNDERQFQGMVLVFRDVTERRRSEQALAAAQATTARSEAELKLIIDALPAYVSYVDRDLRYLRANHAYEELLGRDPAELLGKTVEDALGAEVFARIGPRFQAALAGERQTFSYELTENGVTRTLNASYIPHFAADGSVQGIVIEAHDITDLKRAEATLRRSEERFRSLIERSSVGFVIGNVHGELTYMNPALLRLLGYTAEEVARGEVRWDRLTPPSFAELDRNAIEQLRSTGVAAPYEKAYIAKDGTLVPLLIGASMIPADLAAEESEEVAVFATDLTLQKRAEAVLLQTEKLAVVGKLASSISHEINNPLEAVTNLLYIARMDEGLDPRVRQTLDAADRELARVAQVTSQTLRFHRQSVSATDARPDELVGEVLRLFQARLMNAHIEVRRQYGKDVVVRCFDGDIRQIFANLIGNAIDAMRTGGTLTVRTRFATRWSTGQSGVRVSIADTGCGMSEETRSRIFDAFYTTKGIHGTGLGLWISSSIIQKHQGYLRVYSSMRPGRNGTVFSVWLPSEMAASASESWQLDLTGGV